jgi:hypothetical protein
MCIIKIGVAHKIRVISKMNCSYLEEAFNDIAKIWVDVRKDQRFFSKLRKVVKFYKKYCKREVAMMRKEEGKLKWSLKENQIFNFHSNLNNSIFQE